MLFIDENAPKIKVYSGLTSTPYEGPWHTSYPVLAKEITQAQNDPEIKEIILDFNSPGGELHGIDVALNALKLCTKPTIAYISGCCCSAAYYLASQCTRIIAAGSNIAVGSVGVIMQSFNEKEYAKNYGVDLFQLISHDSPDKREETQEHFEKIYRPSIEEWYTTFVSAIAQGRDLPESVVRKDFGRGAVLTATQALKVGMIDEILIVESPQETTQEETNMTPEEMAAALAADPAKGLEIIVSAFEKSEDLALSVKMWIDENLSTDVEEPSDTPAAEDEPTPEASNAPSVAAKMAKALKTETPVQVASTTMPTTHEDNTYMKHKRTIDARNAAAGFTGHRYI